MVGIGDLDRHARRRATAAHRGGCNQAGCEMGEIGGLGTGPVINPLSLLLPLVFDLAKESGAQKGAGLLDVGESRGQERSLDLEHSIFIDGSHLSALADDEEFVAVTHDLKAVVGVCIIDPLAEELGSGGSAAANEDGAQQNDEKETEVREPHQERPRVVIEHKFALEVRHRVGTARRTPAV